MDSHEKFLGVGVATYESRTKKRVAVVALVVAVVVRVAAVAVNPLTAVVMMTVAAVQG